MSALIIVVMGVAGAGKSTVGQLLASELRCDFLDGDSLHPPANIQKMTMGSPMQIERPGWRPFTPASSDHSSEGGASWSPVLPSNNVTATSAPKESRWSGCIEGAARK